MLNRPSAALEPRPSEFHRPQASCLVNRVTRYYHFLWQQSVPMSENHVISRQSDASLALQSPGLTQHPSGRNLSVANAIARREGTRHGAFSMGPERGRRGRKAVIVRYPDNRASRSVDASTCESGIRKRQDYVPLLDTTLIDPRHVSYVPGGKSWGRSWFSGKDSATDGPNPLSSRCMKHRGPTSTYFQPHRQVEMIQRHWSHPCWKNCSVTSTFLPSGPIEARIPLRFPRLCTVTKDAPYWLCANVDFSSSPLHHQCCATHHV